MPDIEEMQQQLDIIEKRRSDVMAENKDMKAAWTVFMHLMADHLHKRRVDDVEDN